jgi:hypothetical protein
VDETLSPKFILKYLNILSTPTSVIIIDHVDPIISIFHIEYKEKYLARTTRYKLHYSDLDNLSELLIFVKHFAGIRGLFLLDFMRQVFA